ncbi:MAG: ACP S-malonyltransferase [Umezawaea sp.]
MVAWLFPGQGSQRRGMGTGLFERYADLVEIADEQLGYSIARLCLEDPDDQLRNTRFAQPALFVVSALTCLDHAARHEAPAFLAGHSLGEYVALFAARCFDFATGVRLVRLRGELMAQAPNGGMLAVIGSIADSMPAVLAECGQVDIDIANYNTPDQVVLSGPVDSLSLVRREVRARGGRAVPLNVSAAFHSRYMKPASEAFEVLLADIDFADPALPVVSNVTGRPYQPGQVRRMLTEQIHQPVHWADTMQHLLENGVTEVVELGPGRVLGGMWNSAAERHPVFGPRSLGSAEFRHDYGIRYAYLTGSMYHAIASTSLVIRMGKAGLMGFFGTGGLKLAVIDDAITRIQDALGSNGGYGMNLLSTPDQPQLEHDVVDLCLRRGVRHVEAAAYTRITAPLVRYRYTGAYRDSSGHPIARHHVVAKVSRPEVAEAFARPAPAKLLLSLVKQGLLTADEAAIAAELPVSNDLCVEADSGGHTDGAVALTLLPTIRRRADELALECGYHAGIRVGAAGGLGTPEALAAAFLLGADFVITGSINQCTPEAGTSDDVKDLLADLDIQDTAYAPAGDMFEAGAQVQVVRKTTLFAARASRLYQIYRQHKSLDDIDPTILDNLERTIFGRSVDEVWTEVRAYLATRRPDELSRAERDPKRRMALVLRWYFRHSTEVAMSGVQTERVDYQIHCGPAMGAFNQWAKGTDLADWRRRHVDVVAERLMFAAAEFLRDRMSAINLERPSRQSVP